MKFLESENSKETDENMDMDSRRYIHVAYMLVCLEITNVRFPGPVCTRIRQQHILLK